MGWRLYSLHRRIILLGKGRICGKQRSTFYCTLTNTCEPDNNSSVRILHEKKLHVQKRLVKALEKVSVKMMLTKRK